MILHLKRRLVALITLVPFAALLGAWSCQPSEVAVLAYQHDGRVLTEAQAQVIADYVTAELSVPAICRNDDNPKTPEKHVDNCSMAFFMALQKGYSVDDFACLDYVIMRESGWWNVPNAAGGRAYGIPQAFPGSKMSSHGADWATNPITQLHWLFDYISGRYGTPCEAKAFKASVGWY